MTNPNFPELKIDCAHCLFGCSAIREKNVPTRGKGRTKTQLSVFECRVYRPASTAHFPVMSLNDWCGYFCDAETLVRPFVGLNADTLDPARLRHTPAQPRKIHADEQPRKEAAE